MRANEERIVMQYLRAGRFVVRVVEPYEGISQEGSQLSAGLRELACRTGCASDLRTVHLHLQIGVTIVVDSRSPLLPSALFKDGLRHRDFTQLCRERHWPS